MKMVRAADGNYDETMIGATENDWTDQARRRGWLVEDLKAYVRTHGELPDSAAGPDGVSLTSTAHPRSPWWHRVWLWFRRSRLSEDSLETIEIKKPDRD